MSLLAWHPVAGAQQAAPPKDPAAFGGPGVARQGDKGLTLPKVVKEVNPQYTQEAMKAAIQGIVIVECVVKTDGTVGDVRVTRSLDTTYGLDDRAIEAAKAWRFKPGSKNGKPVPVVVTLDFAFALK